MVLGRGGGGRGLLRVRGRGLAAAGKLGVYVGGPRRVSSVLGEEAGWRQGKGIVYWKGRKQSNSVGRTHMCLSITSFTCPVCGAKREAMCLTSGACRGSMSGGCRDSNSSLVIASWAALFVENSMPPFLRCSALRKRRTSMTGSSLSTAFSA